LEGRADPGKSQPMNVFAFNDSALPNPQTIKGRIDPVQFKFLMARINRSNHARQHIAPCWRDYKILS
jgi:hypothetical protein